MSYLFRFFGAMVDHKRAHFTDTSFTLAMSSFTNTGDQPNRCGFQSPDRLITIAIIFVTEAREGFL